MKESIPIYTKGTKEVTYAAPATTPSVQNDLQAQAVPEKKQPEQLPNGIAKGTAKTVKVALVIDPASITHVNSIGKKQTRLEVTADGMKFNATLNSKSYRKALLALEEFGLDGCNVVLQGAMKSVGILEGCGLLVQPKKVKEVAAPEEAKEADAPVETKETAVPVEAKEAGAPVETKETAAPVEAKEAGAPAEAKETVAPTEPSE